MWQLSPPFWQQVKTEQIKNQKCFVTYQRTEVTGPTATIKSGQTDISRVTAKICLPEAEAVGAITGGNS